MKDKVATGDHDDDDDGDGEEEEEGWGWGICAVLGLAPRLAPGICHLHIPRTFSFTPLLEIYLYCLCQSNDLRKCFPIDPIESNANQ